MFLWAWRDETFHGDPATSTPSPPLLVTSCSSAFHSLPAFSLVCDSPLTFSGPVSIGPSSHSPTSLCLLSKANFNHLDNPIRRPQEQPGDTSYTRFYLILQALNLECSAPPNVATGPIIFLKFQYCTVRSFHAVGLDVARLLYYGLRPRELSTSSHSGCQALTQFSFLRPVP